ncbi:nucleoside deaminase [Silvibacterium sp.]|uniref:nucleoside deaminase n=1 Tax=Silvibacterium sp. TaxID=1964179 RepID=UPI0039E29C32
MGKSPNPEFMRRAIELATRNVQSAAGGPFAAVIVRDGVIVGEGANSVTATNDPTAHGEVVAIRDACARLGVFSLEGCEMYTSCEPCPMCLAASYWSRLEAVYYGNDCHAAARAGFDDAFLYEQFRLDRELRRMPSQQVLASDAWESFAAWIDSTEKIEY